MRTFSKSKLLNLRQCSKRLWLEIHRPELRLDSAATQASFQVGFQVGEIARQIYDPENLGSLIDIEKEGFKRAFERSAELLQTRAPIFEAGFSAGGALAIADVMLPVIQDGKPAWRMVEVKSSASVKDYHLDDAAIQAYVARTAGVALQSLSLAHIDSSWTYPGGSDYSGLLNEVNLTDLAFSRRDEVSAWIAEAQGIDASPDEPEIETGNHCFAPYACGFYEYCSRDEPEIEHPIHWLPNFRAAKIEQLAEEGVTNLENVPDDMLNTLQQRVKHHTLTDTFYFNAEGAAAELAEHKLPVYFLDFETIIFTVPIWAGTRPFQQIPFQFSLHLLDETGKLEHTSFLDLSGNNPARAFALDMIEACGKKGPVFVYNAGFEKTRNKELAAAMPDLSEALLAINSRIVDLHPIARQYYYHPSQQGSWSLKAVLPAVVPELHYDALEGVQDGKLAMNAFLEAIHTDTLPERKAEIEQQLLAYCKLDTYAMVRLWQVFAGRSDLKV